MKPAGLLAFLLLFFSCTKQEKESLFQKIATSQSNIYFNNEITDSPEFNILDYLYFYNGGGVATGDLNNDGLPDIFFTSNLGEDKLYFNTGNFTFEDVSNRFEIDELNGWSTGVTLIDVNQDGWLDIYVCKLGDFGPYKNHNKLFINKKGEYFVESAEEYGLDFSGFATQAAFFDYDQDGDLDCYLLNHSVKSPEQFRPSEIRQRKDTLAGDVLLEFEDGHYVDVTSKAGIYSSTLGFGLGIDVADVNNDGWLDIYVGNDFHENDYLYINQQDKTFEEVIARSTRHTSNFSMGCSIADLNNDLNADILTLDMKPFEEAVYKKSGGWESIEIYNFKRSFGYHHQSARNALQMNVGFNKNLPMYSERAAFYGLEATDWSWSPLVFDFDNDGDKDIFITNGIVRRPNDMDFVNFHFDPKDPNKVNQIQKMPKGEVPNCYFENELEENTFAKKDFFENSISTGAAVADFDQDGKLDVIINNINAPASILKNIGNKKQNNYIRVKLEGGQLNSHGIGATIELHQSGKRQQVAIKSSSGFQSFSEPIAHFGMANNTVDSISIRWPDGSYQKENISEINKTYSFKKKTATTKYFANTNKVRVPKSLENYHHQKSDVNDQQTHKWLLYSRSNFGPRMVAETESKIYLTGNEKTPSGFINTETGSFISFANPQIPNEAFSLHFDFDNDGDEDIFIAPKAKAGTYESEEPAYVLVNDNNTYTKLVLPITELVYDAKWRDMDGDGHGDLVLVGHLMPITILYSDQNNFTKKQIPNSNGLWFSLAIEDLNHDGKLDIISGNYGTNHSLKASVENPIRSYQNDFDKNGYVENLVTYVKDGKEVPYPNQSLFAAQIPAVKKNYLKNTDYAGAKITDLLSPKVLQVARVRTINTLESACFLQTENETWKKQRLPDDLQMAPVLAIEKMKDDTFFFGGNFHDVDPNWGRQDASYLSAFEYEDGTWKSKTKELRLPLISGSIRDLKYRQDKLYIAINNDDLKVIDFRN